MIVNFFIEKCGNRSNTLIIRNQLKRAHNLPVCNNPTLIRSSNCFFIFIPSFHMPICLPIRFVFALLWLQFNWTLFKSNNASIIIAHSPKFSSAEMFLISLFVLLSISISLSLSVSVSVSALVADRCRYTHKQAYICCELRSADCLLRFIHVLY